MKARTVISFLVLSTLMATASALPQEGSHTASTADKPALGALDPVALAKGEKAKGTEQYRADFDGFTYLFRSKSNLDAFKGAPEKYAVQDHGNCPVAKVMMNKAVKGKPEIYSVYKGKSYLLSNSDAKEAFDADPEKFAAGTPAGSMREGS